MKPAQTKKIYDKLHPYERAAMALEALQRGDNAEFDVINGSLDKRTADDWHYKRRLMGLTNLGLLYGCTYWKARCMGSDEHIIASMEAALEDIFRQVKISIQAVRKLATCHREQLFDAESINQELLEQYKKLLSDIVY